MTPRQVRQVPTATIDPGAVPSRLQAKLSEKQQQIIGLLYYGLSADGIARQIAWTPDSVKKELQDIYRALGIVGARKGKVGKLIDLIAEESEYDRDVASRIDSVIPEPQVKLTCEEAVSA